MARRSPGFVTLAVATLAVGIGMDVAVFSALRAVVFPPLPYPNAQRLCVLWKTVPQKNIAQDWTSYPTIRDWEKRNRSFEKMAFAIRPDGSRVLLRRGGETVEIQAAKVGGDFFDVLGVVPVLGRTFSQEENSRGADVALLSDRFWKQWFGGAKDVLGRSVEIGGHRTKVIGVMPRSFTYPGEDVQMWLPITADSRWPKFATIRLADAFSAVGKLKPGVSRAQARSDMDGIARQLAREYPETDAGLGIAVRPLVEEMATPRIRQTFWMLFAAVTLLLLIACGNVANLLLARGVARSRELATRSAIGASRWQIVSGLLRESLGLWLCACVLGVPIALVLIRIMSAVNPADVPRLNQAHIDFSALLVALGLSLVTGVLFSLIPAWKVSSGDASLALRRGGVGPSSGHAAGMLIVVECALAALLLAGAGLLARSLVRLMQVDPGYRTDHLLTMAIHLPFAKYGENGRDTAFFEEAVEKIGALPGVVGAAAGGVFRSHTPNDQLIVEGKAGEGAACAAANSSDIVSENYFQVMGIRLLRGRYFSAQDRAGTLPVAIVNETMARQCWPTEDPVGKRFRYGVPGLLSGWITVAGVVADALPNGPESKVVALHYLPLRQRPWVDLDFVVRTASDPASMAAAVRHAIHEMDASVPRFNISTVDSQLARLNAPRRFETWLLGVFSLAALALAALGIYGVVHESVVCRTREIGVRMALGASPAGVTAMVLRQGIAMACIGLAMGLAAALALSRVMQALLFGVTATDPFTLIAVGAVLLGVAAAASAAPAYRAARIDPMTALRAE